MTEKKKTSPVFDKGVTELVAVRKDINATKQAAHEAKREQLACRWDANRAADATELLTCADMLKRCRYVRKLNAVVTLPHEDFEKGGVVLDVLGIDHFKTEYAASVETVPNSKGTGTNDVSSAELWLKDPGRVPIADAGLAIGLPRIYVAKGVCMVNTWTPRERHPATADIAPFLEHIEYLIPALEERERFLDWLAHCERVPEVLPHHGYLFYTPTMGIGRNWLVDVLSQVWPGEVASGLDLGGLLQGAFNDDIAGTRFACVDEIHIGTHKSLLDQAAKLRSMMTASERRINAKYGKKYWEKNSVRWLILSNHVDALPIDAKDRRWAVIKNPEEPKPADYYTRLYNLVTPEFGAAVGAWLAKRDISKFNPGERPAINDAKRAVILAATSQLEQDLGEVLADWKAAGVPGFGSEDLRHALGIDEGVAWTNASKALAFMLQRAGVHKIGGPRPRIKRVQERLYAFDEGFVVDVIALEKAREPMSGHALAQKL
ncbi:hypothetical protein ASE98_23385 [Pseudomonas sp. Leaf48]|uniref:primase-helicase family protein n=1 Tax=Pseudomonas sp. Leaf48 TaxID=1736221 RepID=UPI000729CC08|nr:primase-helicase family protein [Pseudomonas sp. Leaf48]KQN50468.1 hypothetical protein ASE98_23385 [Pseudomonas sp. Leaf48]